MAFQYLKGKIKTLKQNFELFQRILLKFEIIRTEVGQVIRLQNDINFFRNLEYILTLLVF